MKFEGQGKINICGFEYKILQTAVGGGGRSEHPKNTPVSAPAALIAASYGMPGIQRTYHSISGPTQTDASKESDRQTL